MFYFRHSMACNNTLTVFCVLSTGSFTFPASWHLMFGSPVHPQGNLFWVNSTEQSWTFDQLRSVSLPQQLYKTSIGLCNEDRIKENVTLS